MTSPAQEPEDLATDWRTHYENSLLPVFGSPQRMLVKGAGAHVWDETGKEYLDLLAGIAVNALGHAHPALVAAVTEQVSTLGHVSNFFTSAPQIRLAERLLALAGAPQGSAVYFSNSGAEANEAAIKLARRVSPTAKKIVAVSGSFHGRTMGALALTSKEAYRAPFEPNLPGVVHVPFGDTDALAAEVDETCAAVILEPIQGEGGVREHPAGYLSAARELTNRVGALLVLDEVQTGIGRCGTWFAFQDPNIGEGVVPDVVTLAKGLGGGIPIAATLTFGQRASGLLAAGQHGSTYSGNPVSTAAANAVLDVIESEDLLAHVSGTGKWLAEELLALDGVDAVSGAGLLLAAHLDTAVAKDVAAAALDAGFIINPVSEDRIRLAPPLVVTREELQTFLDVLPGLLASTSKD